MGPLEKELGKICFPFTLITNFLSLESKTLKFKNSHQKPSKYQILENVKKKNKKIALTNLLKCAKILS